MIHNKLVRDKIPEIIENNNEKCEVRILNDNEYKLELTKKLLEEANEVKDASNEKELIEELADLSEVILSIMKANNITYEDVNNVRILKKEKRGGFDKKIFLEKTY